MSKPKISIIVPVYNVQKYLCRCIESLISQTYSNLEIILVDDGSIDKSKEICLQFAENDKRIQYYFQNNAGAAAARNNGINHATGKYIGFVDSDDYVDTDMYEVLINTIIKYEAQAVQILSRRVTDGGTILNQELIDRTENNRIITYSSDEAIEHYLLGNHSLWSHLYDASLFRSLRIPEGMSGEDLVVIIPLYRQCSKIVKINQYKYNYRVNPNSVTNAPIDQRKIKLFFEYEKQLDLYGENFLYKDILTFTISKTLAGIINAMILEENNVFEYDEKFFHDKLIEYFSEFKENKFVSKSQIHKFEIYLSNRTFYKFMLIMKRKYFYKKQLYGEE